MDMGDVAHEDRAAVDLLDRQMVQRLDGVGAVIDRQGIILAADLGVAGGQDDVLVVEGGGDVGRGQAARVQRLLVEVGHDDARLAAIGRRHVGAMHDGEIGPDDVLAKIVELGVGQGGRGQGELDDRHVGGGISQHQRGRDAGRQIFQHHQRRGGDLADRLADVGARLQIDLLDADALIGGRFDARNIVDQGSHVALMQRQDAVLDVLGRHAVIGPDDADHRDVDLGENVDRHAERGPDPEQTDQDQAGHHRIGAPQDETYQRHGSQSPKRQTEDLLSLEDKKMN